MTIWAKGSKFETLLGFMANGSKNIGADWGYLSDDGTHMFGIPEPVRHRDWRLKDLPDFWNTIGSGKRVKMRSPLLVTSALEKIIVTGVAPISKSICFVHSMLSVIRGQNSVHMVPNKIFRQNRIIAPVGSARKLLFVVRREKPDITVL